MLLRARYLLVALPLCLFITLRHLRQTLQDTTYSLEYAIDPLRPEKHPVAGPLLLPPAGGSVKIPSIQTSPRRETPAAKELRESRRDEVRQTFLRAWNGYKDQAWGMDEVRPVSGGSKRTFCGWAATMVDTLDTLWIMGFVDQFELAVNQVAQLDFTNTTDCMINTFETTIRHLGGLLSAYDLSHSRHPVLVHKVVELAEMVFTAFDTPNRMPIPFLTWSATDPEANAHKPSTAIGLATFGTLSLEFTRLSQITGNPKYFDAVQRIANELDKWQYNTVLPGMWPTMVNTALEDGDMAIGSPTQGGEESFSLGALADSTYEYLPKEWLLLGGQSTQYRKMYESFVDVAKKHLFFRPMTIGDKDILLSGIARKAKDGESRLDPQSEHLTCFVGGMLAIAGRIFNRREDVEDGRRLTDGCVWAYQNTATGIMPEVFSAVPCVNRTDCPWNETAWFTAVNRGADEDQVRETILAQKLTPGFTSFNQREYELRPEAIESVFILWRITGDPHWPEVGWEMFKAIQAHTTTAIANSVIDDVTIPVPKKVDTMESFWLAETLKYFYLLYSEFDVVSLDEYVLNTEAHPLKRPSRGRTLW